MRENEGQARRDKNREQDDSGELKRSATREGVGDSRGRKESECYLKKFWWKILEERDGNRTGK